MRSAGKKIWVIPDIRIPLRSTGKEPEMLSQDRIAILNTGNKPARIVMTIFREDDEPVEFTPLNIEPGRLRKIRVNDLINPAPVYLETDYSLVIEADCEIIVQHLKMNTGDRNTSITGTIAFGRE